MDSTQVAAFWERMDRENPNFSIILSLRTGYPEDFIRTTPGAINEANLRYRLQVS